MKQKIIIGVSAVIVLSMILYSILTNEKTHASASEEIVETEEVIEQETKEESLFFVEVKGAVNVPGVYTFSEGTRVIDVFNTAGGLSEGANIDYINQSRLIVDEMLIVVLTDEEITERIAAKEIEVYEESAVVETETTKTIIGADNCSENGLLDSGGLISINTASVSELQTLSGIGESKAQAIVQYRSEEGEFITVEEVMNVSGIGEAIFNQIKDSITV